jgi:5-carboxymethyl-2-hydroxymuconic-semialdehyde dehydrogenase
MSKFEENLEQVEHYLRRFRESGVQNHIAGNSVAALSGATFANTTPVDNSHLADVAKSEAADVDAAVKAAQEAFPAWRAMDGAKRRKILHQVADAIEARAVEISLIESIDTGQAIRFMSKAAVRGAENFRFFADKAVEAQDGSVLRGPGQINYTSRRPIGPVAVITPWNTPFMLSTWKIAPALAAGL